MITVIVCRYVLWKGLLVGCQKPVSRVPEGELSFLSVLIEAPGKGQTRRTISAFDKIK